MFVLHVVRNNSVCYGYYKKKDAMDITKKKNAFMVFSVYESLILQRIHNQLQINKLGQKGAFPCHTFWNTNIGIKYDFPFINIR